MQYHPVALGGHCAIFTAGHVRQAGWRMRTQPSQLSTRVQGKVGDRAAAADDASVTDLEKTRSKLSNMTSPGLYLELLNLF